MFDWLSRFLQAFIPLFVAIDPVGLAAIFLGLGHHMDRKQRQKIADQATWTGGLVALGFLFLGQSVFKAVGISVSDFQIAGGLVLFILAARDLIQSAAEPEKLPPDFGVVPLGMPLIAGPGVDHHADRAFPEPNSRPVGESGRARGEPGAGRPRAALQ
ncbi:MAG: MarC family protein [Lacunisphaera sp.]